MTKQKIKRLKCHICRKTEAVSVVEIYEWRMEYSVENHYRTLVGKNNGIGGILAVEATCKCGHSWKLNAGIVEDLSVV